MDDGDEWEDERFNSRTREGCDRTTVTPISRRICFNSRTREGCDQSLTTIFHFKTMFQFTHPRGVRQPRL